MNAGSSKPAARRTILAWLVVAAGLAAALALISFAEDLASRIEVQSILQANALFYGLLFGPLIVLSLILGLVSGLPVMRAGRRPLGWSGLGLALGVGGLVACVGYVWLNGSLRSTPLAPVPPNYLAANFAILLVGVVAEEMLFRGWLLAALQNLAGDSLAVLLSAIAFAGFHLWAGGATDPISLANLMLGGLWFGLLALRTGGIVAPLAAHFGWNAAEDLGFGLVPNPGVGELGALSDHDMTGGVLWGGSEEGLNASIAMTLVLVALVIPLLPSFAPNRAPAQAS